MTQSYRFVISYCDSATKFVGLLLADVTADSSEQASREIEGIKHDRKWLAAAFGTDFDPDDFDPDKEGIVIGDHALIAVAAAGDTEDQRVDDRQIAWR
jgi:hypothetical protein